jgi:hypothetical protein
MAARQPANVAPRCDMRKYQSLEWWRRQDVVANGVLVCVFSPIPYLLHFFGETEIVDVYAVGAM